MAGALLAGLLAVRGELATPVADLLRQVGAAVPPWRAGAAEAVVVALAAAAAGQLHVTGGRLVGIAQLVPVLTVLAIGLLVARITRPVARWAGRRACRRGRIAALLAARHLGRRGSAARLIPLLVVAIALLGFGVAAADVAARGRDAAASVELGAARVLQVRPVPVARLLAATHAADPAGRYAMAAVPIVPLTDEPARLAVDTSRLASVGYWPANAGISAADAAARLHPPAAGPVEVRGTILTADVTVDGGATAGGGGTAASDAPWAGARLSVDLVSPTGLPLPVDLGSLRPGRAAYSAPVACADGCRLAQLAITVDRSTSPLSVAVADLRQRGPGGERTVDGFTDPDRWRLRPAQDVRSAPDFAVGRAGMLVKISALAGPARATIVGVDTPYPLPVVNAGALPVRGVGGLDSYLERVTSAAQVPVLPRVGTAGVLMDLEYAARVGSPLAAVDGEVWLAAGAPAGIVGRLADQGLQVVGERTLADLRSRYEAQGPVAAIRFNLLSTVFVVLLAVGAVLLVATVDRRRYVEELRALRVQGIRRATVASTAIRMYLWVVLVGLAGGAAAAAAAWAIAGPKLPVLSGDAAPVPPPAWPAVGAVLPALGATVAVLGLVIVAAAVPLYRAAAWTGTTSVRDDGSLGRVR